MPSWKKLVTSGSDAAIPSVSPSGDFTIDAGGDIILDADGADILLKDGGTHFGSIKRVTSDLVVKSETQDKDILFKGNDNGSVITALQLDMSDGGKAIFSGVISGDGSELTNLPAQAGTITALNNQTANRLVTIGSTTTELDGEANLTFDGTSLTGASTVTASFGTIQGPGVSIGKDSNAFFGKEAGLNADGDATRNVAIGEAAGKNLSGTATENVAVGYNALYSNTVGDSNSVVGTEALYYVNNESSDFNVAIGKQAGTFDKSGGQITNAIQSIAIGSSTKFNANGGTNEVVIGQGTIGQGSNTVTIGNANTTDVYLSHDSGSAVRGGAFVGTQKAHSSTGSKNVDLSTFANHNITITGNITLTPTNFSGRLGQSGIITLIQDSSGGHSITLNSLFKTPRGDSISFDTTADGISLMSYYVIDASNVAVNYLGPFS